MTKKTEKMIMQETQLGGVSCTLVRSARRTIAIQISPDGSVAVRAPRRCSRAVLDEFVAEKREWITRKQVELRERAALRQEKEEEQPRLSEEEYQRYRELAGRVIARRAEEYARQMQVTYKRITIRDQKTRWGSCSVKGNLNFNWRLILAPAEVLDYVVVHELAHLKEMNHSGRFWKQVETVMPDFAKHRLWLKQNGDMLMGR